MKSDAADTQKYFNRVPKQWDAFYSHESWFMYLINKLLRRGLYERYRLTFENCGDLSGAKVLDIGCGTGRYSVECVKRGADKVVGIDFAPSMIEFARKTAQQMKVADKCEFICDGFLSHPFEGGFDVILALGFFDYIKDPEPIFEKVAQMKPRKFVASFPKFTPIWGFQRAVRYYWIKKCPVYNYTKEQLENLYREAPFQDYVIIPCGRGFVGVAGSADD
jgi:2-polyprenyl-3-methyl-5-hydroxy-6-metoxy-1,4-benzoquinol methylase